MQEPIDAIFFDMGFTLRKSIKITDPEKRKVGLKHIIKRLKLNISPASLDKKLTKRAGAYKQWAQRTMIELSEKELWTKWMLPDAPSKKVKQHAVQLNKYWRDITSTRIVFPEARQVIQELFQRGYRIGLISNTTSSSEVPLTLKEMGLDDCVEVMVLSTLFGKRKPDPAIFWHATQAMLVDPSRCAYVGDQPHRDIAGGRSAGFAKVILIQWPDAGHQLRQDPRLLPDHHVRNLKALLKIFPGRYPSVPRKGINVIFQHQEKVQWNASLSSMWMMGRFADFDAFQKATRGLGFRGIELNHQLDSNILERKEIRCCSISGIHEPCPADVPMPVLKAKDWLISSLDEENRQQGIRMIKRSINLAHHLGVPNIILHAGQIQGMGKLEEKIRKMYQSGKQKSSAYSQLVQQAKKIRKQKIQPHLEAAFTSLQELVEYARPYSIKIGIENRYHFMDLPGIEDLQTLLSVASSDHVGFIFDVGHATALEHMGYFSFEEWLVRFSARIMGVHLHDVNGIEDHLAPGLGGVDFSLLAPYLPQDAFRTLEVKVNNTPEQITAGMILLQQSGIVTKA